MTTYIALLKGINVGGHHSVSMAKLRDVLAGLGYTRPETYIQSGNAIFEVDDSVSDDDSADHSRRIAEALDAHFEFMTPVLIRTVDELASVLARIPFGVDADPKLVQVLFLGAEPTADRCATVDESRTVR